MWRVAGELLGCDSMAGGEQWACLSRRDPPPEILVHISYFMLGLSMEIKALL
jgi:hypothetical protein